MNRVFLGLGSNQGDRAAELRFARQALSVSFPGARFSRVYETEPVEFTDQPWFLNQVAEIGTELPPVALLEWVRVLEKQQGRQRTTPKGPRTLDVDILLFGDLISDEVGLQIPHPGLLKRRFVLVPLAELAPDRFIPGADVSVSGALDRLTDPAQVRIFDGGTATC